MTQRPCIARGSGKTVLSRPPILIVLLFLVLALTSIVWAQAQAVRPKTNAPPAEAAVPPAPSFTHELTLADVSAFVDGIVPLEIERGDIAGAVVTVVKDGKVLFARGYGYSDLEKKLPVSPEETGFRVGSVSH
jgi:CubicO group peptidase (beta-lactamase class C family)